MLFRLQNYFSNHYLLDWLCFLYIDNCKALKMKKRCHLIETNWKWRHGKIQLAFWTCFVFVNYLNCSFETWVESLSDLWAKSSVIGKNEQLDFPDLTFYIEMYLKPLNSSYLSQSIIMFQLSKQNSFTHL